MIFNNNNKVMVIDVESDGLYGESFAIGAVILNKDGSIYKKFSGVCHEEPIHNQFVLNNVLPSLKAKDIVEYETRKELRKVFYEWYMKFKDICTVWADFGVPVESNMIRLMIDENGKEFDGPYPLHEIDTFLLARGYKSDLDRYDFIQDILPDYYKQEENKLKHNPLYDSYISGLALIKASI